MFILSFLEMFKWAYMDTLLTPVLSDYFGLSISVSAYFYFGLTIPRAIATSLL